jgi:hypothetical protein
MRNAFRTLILAGALVALSVPVFSVTQTHIASACSNRDCFTQSTGSGTIDSYFSPLEVDPPTIVCDELQLQGEHPYYYGGCDLNFTTLDPRGNNEGFLVSVSSNGFWSNLAYDSVTGKRVNIPARDLSFKEADATLTHCYGLTSTVACEPVGALTDYYGRSLSSTPLPVLVACPSDTTGKGRWANHVRLDLAVPDAGVGLIFGADALSWYGDFTVTLSEGPDVNYTGAYKCGSVVLV